MSQQQANNMDCSICCEAFNKTTRKQSNCRFCDLAFCTECQKRFLLESFTEPACMACKKGYTREHLLEILPKTFIDSDLKKHRENILYEREKCLLPATQARIETDKEIKQVEEQIAQLKAHLIVLRNGYSSNIIERKEFTRKCPGNNCQGFLSRNFKCGLCEIQVCKECHEIKEKGKEEEHVCDKNNVETVKLLAKDSKPCPACGVVIFKISGCSQMWCTSCHTAFDWTSGRIEKGVIHNPHYYEYQRATNGGVAPRVPGDVPCGGNYINDNSAYISWSRLEQKKIAQLQEIVRMIRHIRFVELPKVTITNEEMRNEDIRKKFLENEIDDTKFKWLLQKREKSNTIKREIRQVYDMFINCSTDIIRKTILDHPMTRKQKFSYVEPQTVEDALKELKGLVAYTNETFKKIGEIYGVISPLFDLCDSGLIMTTQNNQKITKKRVASQV